MLPLAGSSLPNSAETLADALRIGLAAHGVSAVEVAAVGSWPRLDLLHLDLSGTSLDALQSFPRGGSASGETFATSVLELRAKPARFRAAPIDLSIAAHEATFSLASIESGAVALLTGAKSGEIAVEMERAALEQLIHQLAVDAAGEHGVEIKKTTVKLTSRGPRAVSISAEVTAKAFIATATVTISGDADIDEQLVARLSNLRFAGDGMIANLAGSVIRPQLAQLEGKAFPLASFALGEVTLHDLALETGEKIRLTARFGSQAYC